MAAFNYIRIQGKYPECNQMSSIMCQTHVASDYDGNLDVDRFCDHVYELGQKIPWFKGEDSDLWHTFNELKIDDNVAREDCFSKYESCQLQIKVVIQFENIIPVKVLKIHSKQWRNSGITNLEK